MLVDAAYRQAFAAKVRDFDQRHGEHIQVGNMVIFRNGASRELDAMILVEPIFEIEAGFEYLHDGAVAQVKQNQRTFWRVKKERAEAAMADILRATRRVQRSESAPTDHDFAQLEKLAELKAQVDECAAKLLELDPPKQATSADIGAATHRATQKQKFETRLAEIGVR